jgi:VanZ family protein
MLSIFVQKPDPLELRLRTSGRGQVWVWLPAVIAAMVIATESTNTFSAAHTSSWLRPIFESLVGKLTDSTWDRTNHLLRKTGHFCGYGTVCLTFLRAWLLELGRLVHLGRRVWRQRSCVLAVLSTAVIACLDEWHQTYIPSRTGTVRDALLDTCGATISCVLVWVFVWRRRTGLPAR